LTGLGEAESAAAAAAAFAFRFAFAGLVTATGTAAGACAGGEAEGLGFLHFAVVTAVSTVAWGGETLSADRARFTPLAAATGAFGLATLGAASPVAAAAAESSFSFLPPPFVLD